MTDGRSTVRTHRRIMMLRFAAVFITMCGTVLAQAPSAVVPHPGLPVASDVTVSGYRAHLESLQQLVKDCARSDDACDATRVGSDDRVAAAGRAAYTERYGWLRDLLEDRSDPNHALRGALLPHAGERLDEQRAEIDAPKQAVPMDGAARAARENVLGRREFRTDRGYSLTDQASAWISRQFAKLFTGASSLGRAAPWLGTALQWAALLAVAVLLLVWVYRALDRQRVGLGRLHGGGVAGALAASRAWAEQAREHAERGAWREAVHALYWASIVVLEDRKTLRRSGTRTPREALGLIDHASPLGELLREQTGAFERIWYGLEPADAGDYERARSQYDALHDARSRAVPA